MTDPRHDIVEPGCWAAEQLTELAGEEARGGLARHLETCEHCRELWESARAARLAFRAASHGPAPERWAAFMRALERAGYDVTAVASPVRRLVLRVTQSFAQLFQPSEAEARPTAAPARWVTAGAYRLNSQAAGPGMELADPLAAEVADYQVSVDMRMTAAGVTINATVAAPEGTAAPGVEVVVQPLTAPGAPQRATTDAEGAVSFGPLPLGDYEVTLGSA